MSQFSVKRFLKCLDFQVLVLRAGMTEQECFTVKIKFNDENSKAQILVVIYVTCAVGLNLHHKCANVVFMEPAISANMVLQGGGWVHWLGQTHPQRVWILSGENMFDWFVE